MVLHYYYRYQYQRSFSSHSIIHLDIWSTSTSSNE